MLGKHPNPFHNWFARPGLPFYKAIPQTCQPTLELSLIHISGEDGGTLIVANNDEGDEVRFALYDIDEELTASGFIQFVPEHDCDYFYNEHNGVAYQMCIRDRDMGFDRLCGKSTVL